MNRLGQYGTQAAGKAAAADFAVEEFRKREGA